MKLFLFSGFKLDENDPTYRDKVLALGYRAEAALVAFLQENGISAKGSSSVVKKMRDLHRSGALNQLINDYKTRLNIGTISDPSPKDTQNVFAPTN